MHHCKEADTLHFESATYHSGSGVDDLHLLEDGGTVIGDEHLAFGGLNLCRRGPELDA